MDFEKMWNDALRKTEIVRNRVQMLMTSQRTLVPYILLSESSINQGDTVVRRGQIFVEKPSLIVPPNHPQFNGFDFDGLNDFNENTLINFLILRGVSFPSFRYDNKTSSLDVFEGRLSNAVKHYEKILQEKEDVLTGLLIGPEDFWQISLIIFICTQIAKNANYDIKRLLSDHNKKDKND